MTNEQGTAAPKSRTYQPVRCDACSVHAGREIHHPAPVDSDLDSIAALDREDVEAAIELLRYNAGQWANAKMPSEAERSARWSRVADALAEHLIDRHD